MSDGYLLQWTDADANEFPKKRMSHRRYANDHLCIPQILISTNEGTGKPLRQPNRHTSKLRHRQGLLATVQ